MKTQDEEIEVVKIQFRNNEKSYFFSANGLNLKKDDKVIVNSKNNLEYGVVVEENIKVNISTLPSPLRKVERLATKADMENLDKIKKLELKAFKLCKEKIKKYKLAMKLLTVEYSFDLSRALFLFVAEERIDFRELVKDLASVLRIRIELHQIGVRDQARMFGGLGVCGQEFCCKRFLNRFHSVSIKMAKQQSLSLNPIKISGMCGRLMCCLKYEQEAYSELQKGAPKIGIRVSTPEGEGKVIDVNPMSQEVRVKLDSEDFAKDRFKFEDIQEI